MKNLAQNSWNGTSSVLEKKIGWQPLPPVFVTLRPRSLPGVNPFRLMAALQIAPLRLPWCFLPGRRMSLGFHPRQTPTPRPSKEETIGELQRAGAPPVFPSARATLGQGRRPASDGCAMRRASSFEPATCPPRPATAPASTPDDACPIRASLIQAPRSTFG